MTVRYKTDLELGKEHKFLTPFSQLIIFNRAWPLKLSITQDSLNRLYITLKPGWYVDIKPAESEPTERKRPNLINMLIKLPLEYTEHLYFPVPSKDLAERQRPEGGE